MTLLILEGYHDWLKKYGNSVYKSKTSEEATENDTWCFNANTTGFQLFSFTHSRLTYSFVRFLYKADSSNGSTDSKEILYNPKVNFSAL